MKTFKYLSVLFLIILVFASCGEQEEEVYTGESDNFRFLSPTRYGEVDENASSPVVIPIVYSKSSPRSGSVSVSFSGATEGTDFVVLPGTSFDFGADQYYDTLYVQPIPDGIETGDKELIISLNSSTERIGWAGDTTSQDYTLVIKDLEAACPPINIAGTYDAVATTGCAGDGQGGCQDITGWTGVVTFTAVGGNDFELDDPSFGLYPDGYGIAAPGVGIVTEDCGNLILEAGYADQYSDPWTFSGITDGNANMVITWNNTWGDGMTLNVTPQ